MKIRTGLLVLTFSLFHICSDAQNYLQQVGSPTFAKVAEVESGWVNLANGNLHLQIPIASPPQRGSAQFSAQLIYDSRIWKVDEGSWRPSNVPGSWGGWRFVTSVDPGNVTYDTSIHTCAGSTYYTTYSNFAWTEADGTPHAFPITTQQDFGCGVANTSSGTAFAEDSTGYRLSVTNFTTAVATDNRGTQVYPSIKDANGNFFSRDANGNVVDTLGRTVVSVSVSGNLIYLDVLNAQGQTSRFTVTTFSIPVNTAFGQAGIAEYSGSLTVVQSVSLPDSSSYIFNYDSGYGLLQTMTLPTGGAVSYTHMNYQDAYGNVNQWISSRTVGSAAWSYAPAVINTCSTGSVGCQQNVTVTRPAGDTVVYTFTLNNGAWNTETDFNSGSATLLRSVVTSYDFSNACSCGVGAAYIRPLQVTTSEVSSPTPVNKQTQYVYDSPQKGNVSAIKEWNYYSGSPGQTPTRETDVTYLTTGTYLDKNIIALPIDIIVKSDAGTQVAETKITYDSTSLTSVTGVVSHDDTDFGTGNTVRGNPSVYQRWTGSAYLGTTIYYDTTGQVTKITDPAANSTSFSYGDRFFDDNGANPPSTASSSKTNASLTRVTLPITGSLSFGYYFGTGQLAQTIDQNGGDNYTHYLDALDRKTHYYGPTVGGGRPWRLIQYTRPNLTDMFVGLNDAAASSGCSSCRHDELVLDGLGRTTQRTLVSDPSGSDMVDITYDSSGRFQAVSNPYRTTSEPTYGIESYAYDALDRLATTTLADGNVKQTYYGSAVTAVGGNAAQLCSTALYGFGYPTVTVDEAGNKKQTWKDGFDRIIEVDEPNPSSGNSLSLNTCYAYSPLGDLTQVVQGVQTRTFSYDALSRLTAATNPESGTTTFSYVNSHGALCSGDPRLPCVKTDARRITTTYAYDALGRLASKNYSDNKTPAVYFYYDEATATVGKNTYPLGNTLGRLSHTRTSSGNQAVITMHSYDAAGRTTALWQCELQNCTMRASQYSYNLAGDVTSWVHPYGYTVTNEINNAQHVARVSSTRTGNFSPPTIATFTHNASGRATQVAWGYGGAVELIDYNNRSQISRMQFGTPESPSSIHCLVYNYYPNVAAPSSCAVPASGTGNNGSVRNSLYIAPPLCTPAEGCGGWPDLSNRSFYSYDSLNRLTSAVAYPYGGGWESMNLQFSYDQYGNMTCTPNAYTNGYCSPNTFDASTNRLTRINGSVTPSYDSSGNLTSDGTNAYTWDAEGRLIQAGYSGLTYMYSYNALGQLVQIHFAGSNGRSTDAEYVYDPNGRVVEIRDGEYSSTGDVGVKPFPLDSLPSPHAFYNDGGGLAANPLDAHGSTTSVGDGWNMFYPWGKDWTSCNMYGNDYEMYAGFTAKYCPCLDWIPSPCGGYNSAQGRWMSPENSTPDLSDPQSLNPYSYDDNDPVSPGGSDDQGKAPLSRRDQQRYDASRSNLLQQLQAVSQPCADLLSDIEFTPQVVRDAVSGQRPWDGKRSCISNRDAGTLTGPRPADPIAAKSFDNEMNSPVSIMFKETSIGTTWAVAQLGGPDVYFRPGGLLHTRSVDPWTILHEALHNLGKTDPQIKEKWHLPSDYQGTDDITKKLIEKDCVKN